MGKRGQGLGSFVARIALIAFAVTGCKLPFGGHSSDGSASAAFLSAQDPDGIYGISPRAFKVAATTSAQYPSYGVFSADTAGEARLQTDLASGWINGISPSLSYGLRVYGIDNQGARSARPLAEYHVRSWSGFDKAALDIQKVDNARFMLSWNYAPWSTLPAGWGILDATKIRCAVKSNATVGDDPFAGGKLIEGPLADGKLLLDAFELGLSGSVLVGCQAAFADKSVDTNARRLTFKPTFALAPCANLQGIQDRDFTCSMAFLSDSGQSVTPIGTAFEPDPSQNTCAFLATSDGIHLTGRPNDNQVGDCTLAYRVKGASGNLVMVQPVHIANVQPRFLPSAGMPHVVTEDVAGSADGGFTMILDDLDVETDEEVAGRKAGIVFGTYSETLTSVTNPCSNYGTVKIETISGRTLFKPEADYYGVCNIGIQYDDGNSADGNNLAVRVVPVRVLARNDAPVISGGPGAGSPRVENCGDHCYVGAEYDFTLASNPGGGKYVELDQTLSMKCASSDTTVLQVTYCALDPKTKKLEISFAPVGAPASGAPKPIITVKATDDGYDEVATGNYGANGLAEVTRKPNPLTSSEFSFAVDIGIFAQTLRPAVAVSKAGCLSCHANIDGDFLTDFGYAHARSDFWESSLKGADPSASNQYVLGDQLPAAYGIGFNTIENLSGNFYVPHKLFPQINPSGKAYSDMWTYNIGAVSPFSDIPFLAEFISTPGRVEKRSDAWMPNPLSPVYPYPAIQPLRYNSKSEVHTFMNPEIAAAGKVLDTLTVNGIKKNVRDIIIDYPLSADIKAIDRRNRIDWTSNAAQYAYLGAAPIVNGVTMFDGLTIATSSADPKVTFVSNDQSKAGVVTCLGDVLVKGSLVLYGATFKTVSSKSCRFYVDGTVFIAGIDGQTYGLDVQGGGNLQITSTQGIVIGMGPTMLRGQATKQKPDGTIEVVDAGGWGGYSWIGPSLHDTAVSLGVVTDERFDGCHGQGCTEQNARSFQFDHLMLNAPFVFSRYIGEFRGSIIADFAAFRLSHLKYVYQPALANDVPFPRLRALRNDARPKGMIVYDVVLE